MDVNAGATVRPLSHHSRDDRHASSVQSMRDALNGDCFDEGIGKDDLLPVHRGRIAFVGGFDIRVQNFANFRKGFEELQAAMEQLAPRRLASQRFMLCRTCSSKRSITLETR